MRAWIDATVERANKEAHHAQSYAVSSCLACIVVAFAPVADRSFPIQLALCLMAFGLTGFFGCISLLQGKGEGAPAAEYLSPEETRILSGLFLRLAVAAFAIAGGLSLFNYLTR